MQLSAVTRALTLYLTGVGIAISFCAEISRLEEALNESIHCLLRSPVQNNFAPALRAVDPRIICRVANWMEQHWGADAARSKFLCELSLMALLPDLAF